MESRTLVCDRCARESKFTIAVDSAIVQTRAHGTFRIDLCAEHQESLVRDLALFQTDNVVLAILEHTLQQRPGVPVRQLELQRISGAGRKLVGGLLHRLAEEKKVSLGGKTKDRSATWVATTNGVPAAPETAPVGRYERARRNIAWLRVFLREHKQVSAIDLAKAARAAGIRQGGISYARKQLTEEKTVRVKGTRSRATYIYLGD